MAMLRLETPAAMAEMPSHPAWPEPTLRNGARMPWMAAPCVAVHTPERSALASIRVASALLAPGQCARGVPGRKYRQKGRRSRLVSHLRRLLGRRALLLAQLLQALRQGVLQLLDTFAGNCRNRKELQPLLLVI